MRSTRLSLSFLIVVKIAATLFAILVYSRFTQLGDAERYLSASVPFSLTSILDRTTFTDLLFSSLRRLFASDLAVHLGTSLLVAITLWATLRRSYPYADRRLLWLALLLPHFLVWTSVVGKEAIAVISFTGLVWVTVQLVVHGRLHFSIFFFSTITSLLIRPHYFIAYAILFFGGLVSRLMKKQSARLGIDTYIFLSVFVFLGISILLTFSTSFWGPYLLEVMQVTEGYFLSYDAASNRLAIDWDSPFDFFMNAWWGIPFSIIGPLPTEVVTRPILLPVLLEGLASALLFVILFLKVLAHGFSFRQHRLFLFLGFIPAVVVEIIVHYPFGLFNPGSALRYKQSIAPLLYLFPIMFLAEFRLLNSKYRAISSDQTRPSTQTCSSLSNESDARIRRVDHQ